MTVKELKEILNGFNEDMKVENLAICEGMACGNAITEVYVDTNINGEKVVILASEE